MNNMFRSSLTIWRSSQYHPKTISGAVQSEFSRSRRIILKKAPCCSGASKSGGSNVYSYQNFIANSMQLKCNTRGFARSSEFHYFDLDTSLIFGDTEYRELNGKRFSSVQHLAPPCLDMCEPETIRRFF